ncbi:response regulator [Dyadobacter sandarakinus]|uniref:Response regulator n=1 Tax=Dyadobacter sandarakinus TaxID=2747268 RepID=A0ABX7I3S0_9BACT|nr:response regulator [Dyadobacter sandarakinus]QRR00714.1 response regulator [Dyadobacter sandarakinus]
MQESPIIYVGGDDDDRYLVGSALDELGFENEIIYFNVGTQLVDYLNSAHTKPFIILCDLNLPGMSGLELRETLNQEDSIRGLSIPFIFLSEVIRPKDINQAYQSLVQGFYKKPSDFQGLKNLLSAIYTYWSLAVHPSKEM